MNGFLIAGLFIALAALDGRAAEPAGRFTIGKDTSVITEPRDKDGRIDYAAALNARSGRGVKAETNAMTPLWEAAGRNSDDLKRMPPEHFKLLGMDGPPKSEGYVPWSRHIRERYRDDPDRFARLNEAGYEARNKPWSRKDHPELAAWLELNAEPLKHTIEASKREQYFCPLLPPVSKDGERGSLFGVWAASIFPARELARALETRAKIFLHEGKPDDAWRDIMAVRRLSRLLASGPGAMELLIGCGLDQTSAQAAIWSLASPGLDAKILAARSAELDGLKPIDGVTSVLDVHERYVLLDFILFLDRSGVKRFELLRLGDEDDSPFTRVKFGPVDWDPAMKEVNTRIDRAIDVLKEKDIAKRRARAIRLHEECRELVLKKTTDEALERGLKQDASGTIAKLIGEFHVPMMVAAAIKLQESVDITNAKRNQLRIAFALATYRAENEAYPASLDALVPKYLTELPKDPFTGKSFVYARRDGGWFLSSVGPNGTDDDGVFDKEKKKDDITLLFPPK